MLPTASVTCAAVRRVGIDVSDHALYRAAHGRGNFLAVAGTGRRHAFVETRAVRTR